MTVDWGYVIVTVVIVYIALSIGEALGERRERRRHK